MPRCVSFSRSFSDSEMAGRHRARRESIQIVKTTLLKKKELIREQATIYAETSVRFPVVKPGKRAPLKKYKTIFKADRPTLI